MLEVQRSQPLLWGLHNRAAEVCCCTSLSHTTTHSRILPEEPQDPSRRTLGPFQKNLRILPEEPQDHSRRTLGPFQKNLASYSIFHNQVFDQVCPGKRFCPKNFCQEEFLRQGNKMVGKKCLQIIENCELARPHHSIPSRSSSFSPTCQHLG